MNPATIYHRPLSEFAFATDGTHYVFRLRTGKGEARSCRFFYADRAAMAPELDFACLPMKKIREDRYFDWYEVRLETKLERIAYWFELSDGAETLCYFGDCYEMAGTPTRADYFQLPFNHRADRLSVPEWTKDAVVYNIFPDSFADGFRTLSGGSDGKTGLGGTIRGVTENLDYIASMGFNCIYLNPIFAAESYHRYDTLDYYQVDPHMGSKEDVRALVEKAHSLGIRVLLDGVFNHTGSNSRYFNADGFYPEPGAAQSKDSPYFPWYSFHPWPTEYDAWWGIHTLPAVNEDAPDYRRFIISDEDSVVRRWLRCGADGWRLDVADELPDDFIAAIRSAIAREKPDGYLLGEVWEDGSNKIAYSRRRRYLLGRETHGLMNYPFRTALLAWLGGGDAADFRRGMETIRENYPPAAFYGAMNFLGTHDTARILTLLGAEDIPADKPERAAYRLSPAALARGQQKLRLAGMLLYSFPGSPTLYYGDEAGMQGFEDPLNRGTYPWGQEDEALLAFFRQVGKLRQTRPSLRRGPLPVRAGRRAGHRAPLRW